MYCNNFVIFIFLDRLPTDTKKPSPQDTLGLNCFYFVFSLGSTFDKNSAVMQRSYYSIHYIQIHWTKS